MTESLPNKKAESDYYEVPMWILIVIAIVGAVVIGNMYLSAQEQEHLVQRCMELKMYQPMCDAMIVANPGFDCMMPLSEFETTRDTSPWAKRICTNMVLNGWK